MEHNDEICAFIIGGRHVCFHCYDPNTDKEDDILSCANLESNADQLCQRCHRMIMPLPPVIATSNAGMRSFSSQR